MLKEIEFAICSTRPVKQPVTYDKNKYVTDYLTSASPTFLKNDTNSKQIPSDTRSFELLKHKNKNKPLLLTCRRNSNSMSKVRANNNNIQLPSKEIEMLLLDRSTTRLVKANSVEFYDNVNMMSLNDDYFVHNNCLNGRLSRNTLRHNRSIEHF